MAVEDRGADDRTVRQVNESRLLSMYRDVVPGCQGATARGRRLGSDTEEDHGRYDVVQPELGSIP